ncbi:FUSC family protein [Streptomyces roseoverticillatus]|uniref:FUSC family protein n=1 Tax=Streptomyces roseoverticillatus TaxID=66429 RepID=UPI000693F931|nr:FUSC family protein [Streptomyces roseoverticillatus]
MGAGVSTPVHRLLRHEGVPQAARRALWVVAAGCPGFYLFRYVTGDSVMALYAMFGALPLAMFCRVPGPAPQRTRTLLAALPVGWVLVTAGTLLAVSPWAAAAGMFAVGFAISFCGVGGPRLTGLAMAFQLFYVLPCFPPYEPGTLGSRLAGLTAGILLTVLAERFLLPEPDPVPYRAVLAGAAAAVADYTSATAYHLEAGGGALAEREAADRALAAARLSRVPVTERPASPSAHDRALNHTRAAVRHVRDQLDRLADCPGPLPADPAAVTLLRHTELSLRSVAGALRTGTADAHTDPLPAALAAFDAARAAGLRGTATERLRQDAVARAAAEGTRLATEAAGIALGNGPPAGHGPPAGDAGRPARPGTDVFAYATTPPYRLWWRRLRVHLTPHSVHLQNALRLAAALACARLVVGALDLSHGFWVLLATLSLMRTSAADTRAALRPALTGTVAGAAAAALLLYAVGDRPLVYAVALPFVMFTGFTAGPPLGPAWMQAAFTLVVVFVFAQFSTADWRLSEARILDVLVGSAIGVAAGLLAWPRGGRGELGRDMADFLAECAVACRAVTALLGDDRFQRERSQGDPLQPARRAMHLAEASFAQYLTERMHRVRPEQHWEAALATGRAVVHGAELLLMTHQDGLREPLPPGPAAALTGLAGQVAQEVLRAADSVRSGGPREPRTTVSRYPAEESGPLRRATEGQAGVSDAHVMLIVDTEAWLTGVAHDAVRTRAAPARRDVPATRRADPPESWPAAGPGAADGAWHLPPVPPRHGGGRPGPGTGRA